MAVDKDGSEWLQPGEGDDPKERCLAPDRDELRQLRDENARLKTLLSSHGIAWDERRLAQPEDTSGHTEPLAEQARLTTAEKVALFRRLFRGRADGYALRWESAKGKSGYAPACDNEWKPGICHKPKVKCGDCPHRMLLPVTDQVIHDHLAGKQTVGAYPLLNDDTCYFLAADFDEADWREDAVAFRQICRDLEIPAALEISRSGNGAHVWIFFSDRIPAKQARQLGAALISHTCNRTRQLSLSSYDRLFPNQDYLPKGGFGNLIALPLQKHSRAFGCSVFVDDRLEPYADQWGFLATIQCLSRSEVEEAISRITGGQHPLDVAFIDEEGLDKPWERPVSRHAKLPGLMPERLRLVLANQIFIAKADLPQALANRLIRVAAFDNPEFYKAQAMRLPVWNKPRIIACAENFPQHIGLPRGCLEAVLGLLEENNIQAVLQDKRVSGRKLTAKFRGTLRKGQKAALRETLKHEVGVLCAPTAFGKTVTAAALIARRKVSTMVLVHRTELLRQWQERLTQFLALDAANIGALGGGKKKVSGNIDIAVMQSLSRQEDISSLLDCYGQIIVDECHHISAFSFECILKEARARYVVGLTATPVRRDGRHPIIFMQAGPIRYSAGMPETAPDQLAVWPNYLSAPRIAADSPIQEVFRSLASDQDRNRRVASDVRDAYQQGRKVLVLTERTHHLALLQAALGDAVKHCFVLHGRLTRKQRDQILAKLEALDDSTPRVLLATGRLVGEGFDHPPLDTLVLAMPISWKGTLQQYAGRLHREHAGKQDVRIYDYVEPDHPQLARMWSKRQRGYRAMGYEIRESESGADPNYALRLPMRLDCSQS